jgi:hypothetical protein
VEGVSRSKVNSKFLGESSVADKHVVRNKLLKRQIATLQARLDITAKDMSLVSLIQNWSGTTKSVPLHVFINSVETTADIGNWTWAGILTSCGLQELFSSVDATADLGNWTDANKIRVATLKVVDTARACWDATPERHCRNVTGTTFKKCLLVLFKDSSPFRLKLVGTSVQPDRRRRLTADTTGTASETSQASTCCSSCSDVEFQEPELPDGTVLGVADGFLYSG